MDASTFLLLALGVVGTWLGAELLVRGSARLALALGIRPMVVGLTVVALGTSSPEAVVSFVAAAKGSGGIAVGNVFGSNIANIGLILGAVCLLHPLRVNWGEVRLDLLFMMGATLVASGFVYADALGRPAGVVLLALLVASLVHTIRRSRREIRPAALDEVPELPDGGQPPDRRHSVIAVFQALAGLVVLVFGARWLVGAAEEIALAFGIPEEIIGATMVAVGTSLPELAASVVAVVRGHHDIGIGNIVGSNHMNLLFVLGGVCAIRPQPVDPNVKVLVVPMVLLLTLVLFPLLRTGHRVGRREGGLLLGAYVAFSVYSYLGG